MPFTDVKGADVPRELAPELAAPSANPQPGGIGPPLQQDPPHTRPELSEISELEAISCRPETDEEWEELAKNMARWKYKLSQLLLEDDEAEGGGGRQQKEETPEPRVPTGFSDFESDGEASPDFPLVDLSDWWKEYDDRQTHGDQVGVNNETVSDEQSDQKELHSSHVLMPSDEKRQDSGKDGGTARRRSRSKQSTPQKPGSRIILPPSRTRSGRQFGLDVPTPKKK